MILYPTIARSLLQRRSQKIGGRGVIASAVQRVDHVGIRIDVEYPVVNVSNDNVGNIEYHEQPR